MKENVLKGTFAVILAGLTAYFGKILIPVIMLVVVMLLDYATGLAKAWTTSQLCSRIGIKGIFKKVGYLAIVAVGGAVDWLIASACGHLGVDVGVTYLFGLAVIIWLILNELISILENLSIVGVPIPNFLNKIISKLKIKVEEKAGDTDE